MSYVLAIRQRLVLESNVFYPHTSCWLDTVTTSSLITGNEKLCAKSKSAWASLKGEQIGRASAKWMAFALKAIFVHPFGGPVVLAALSTSAARRLPQGGCSFS